MEDIEKIRKEALLDIVDDDDEWDEETKKNWEEKMSEPVGYEVVNKNENKTGKKETA